MPDVLLNVTQTAAALGVHANTVRKWADSGVLKPAQVLRPSGYRRFAPADVERLRARLAGDDQPPPSAAAILAGRHAGPHDCLDTEGRLFRAQPGDRCLIWRLAHEVRRLERLGAGDGDRGALAVRSTSAGERASPQT